MPKHLAVNQLIPASEDAIHTFEAKLDRDGNVLRKENLPLAYSLLEELIAIHEEFHVKVEAFGPKKLLKFEDDHEYTVQQRCYGDGADPSLNIEI